LNSVRLHQQLVQFLAAIGVDASQPQRTNLAGLGQALAFSANCHLATLALGLPFAGQRENLIQRLRRFLKNTDVNPLARREVDCFIRADRANNAPWNLRYWGIRPAGPPWDKMQVPQNARNPTDYSPWGSKYA
jgi:hypothetical protein